MAATLFSIVQPAEDWVDGAEADEVCLAIDMADGWWKAVG